MSMDEQKSKNELLYELRLLRLENSRLQERCGQTNQDFIDQCQLNYLESTALIDKEIRQTTDLAEMLNRLMGVLRSIFQCDQAWLLHPCDPEAESWKVPFRSTDSAFPIPFGPDDDLAASPDLAENCRLALASDESVPLGLPDSIKDVPVEARKAAAKSALLIALHPKVGRPWLMGLHQCSQERSWTPEEKRMFQDISGRIADALSTTLFYQNLEQNQNRLKHLSTQLFRVQEEERKRLAEEIHDELGQAALAVNVGVENALFLMDDAAEPAIRSLRSASNLSKKMVETMRRMQRELYPPTLRDFGVISALNTFLDDFSNIYSMEVRRGIHVTEDAIPEPMRTTIFRLALEALHNAGKHSKASSVTVVLDYLGDQLFLEVTDEGVGFDPNVVLRYPATRLGLGLTSMRERAEMSGGIMKIDSELGRGTIIRFRWQLDTS